MLRMAIFVLHQQRPYLGEHPGAAEAYRAGLAFWKLHYGKQLIRDVRADIAAGRLRQACSSCAWWLALAAGAEPRTPPPLVGAA
jgi:hypothetical protein